MDINSLSITLPTITSLGLFFIGVMTFLGNRKKQNKEDTKEAVTESNEQVRLLTSIDGRLSTIEKNTEAQGKHLEKHDDEIHGLDNRVVALECGKAKTKKGGHK